MKNEDRRVQRTRRTLREALISLLIERGWDAFSVQDVCDRADVGRSTFYTHFTDKEDLLLGGFDDLRKMLREQIAGSRERAEPLSFARGMFEHAFENRRVFQALMGKRSGQVVLRRFRELVISLVREGLSGARGASARKEPTIHFIAGGFLELLTFGLEAGRAVAPAELERLFREMAAPAVRALREGRT